jgi:hypothetical protein
MHKLPTQERLKELFDYKDGFLIRKISTNNRVKVGDRVGVLEKHGYLKTSIKCIEYRVHRLIYAWFNGFITDGLCIDHIDGDVSNNKIENLRQVTHSENHHNLRSAKGYNYHKKRNQWRAYITANKKVHNLGWYKTAKEAKKAYWVAKKIYHPTSPLNNTEGMI